MSQGGRIASWCVAASNAVMKPAVMADDLNTPLMPPLEGLPEALRDLRDERRQKFAWNYVFNGANGAAAARAAGYSDESEAAKVRAHALLQRDDVQEAVQALTGRYIFSLAPKAVLRLNDLLDNPKHPKHERAIDMVLSRSGHGEKTTVDVNVRGSIQVNHTDHARAVGCAAKDDRGSG
jgi:terminase small subunit-like protein